MTLGGVAYFSKDIVNGEGWKGTGHDYYRYDAAYLNGAAEPESFYVDSDLADEVFNITKGFYEYTLDAETGYVVELTKTTKYEITTNSQVTGDIDNSDIYIDEHPVSENVAIADIREDKDDVWTIEELADFMRGDYNWGEVCDIVYFVDDGEVTVIYVVDEDEVNWTVKAISTVESAEYTAKVNGETSDVVDAYDSTVTVTLSREEAFKNAYIKVTYNTDGETDQVAYVEVEANTDKSFDFKVKVAGNTTITVTNVEGQATPWVTE